MATGFEGKKVIVIGGSAGMGRQAALDVVQAGGSAVVVGRDTTRVRETQDALSAHGKVYGLTAELTDRDAVSTLQNQLADEHADATLLLNAAGFFVPKGFLDYNADFYDSYLSLNYALFFLTQTVTRGMITHGSGSIVFAAGAVFFSVTVPAMSAASVANNAWIRAPNSARRRSAPLGAISVTPAGKPSWRR